MRIISVYPNFANEGGAQDVTLQLACCLNNELLPIVLIDSKLDSIAEKYKGRADFRKFSWRNVFHLATQDTIFISHHRKTTSFLLFFSFMMGNKLKILHVAHSTFQNLKYFTFFPKYLVAVSNGVKINLENYFHIQSERIQVIMNGLADRCKVPIECAHQKEIVRILLAGRICSVKRQLEIVRQCKTRLASHIFIDFAGKGEDTELLKEVIRNYPQFSYIGFIDIYEKLPEYDYVMLFSEKEGLPLSLIQGCMFGKPLITNDLPSVLDINEEGKTGFVFSDFSSLLSGINQLPLPGSETYCRLSLAARKKYETEFTEERMVSSYQKIIKTLFSYK